MVPATHVVTLPGPMLRRGFWLYVCRVETPEGELPNVGRTDDKSSPHSTAPYMRMGQHLGFAANQNTWRRHQEKRQVDLATCTLHLVSQGPLYDEVEHIGGATRDALMKAYMLLHDILGAMEKALADPLGAADYTVLKTASCRWPRDAALWAPVRDAFAEHFPKLNEKAIA